VAPPAQGGGAPLEYEPEEEGAQEQMGE